MAAELRTSDPPAFARDRWEALKHLRSGRGTFNARLRAWDYLSDLGMALDAEERALVAAARETIVAELARLGGSYCDGRLVYRLTAEGKIRRDLPGGEAIARQGGAP